MKAAVLKQIGSIERLKENLMVDDIPRPLPGIDEVLLNIKYASLNHRDLWIAKGLYPKIKLPVILGSDCAAIVHSDSNGDFKMGEEVIVNPGFNWGSDEAYQSKYFKILGMPDNGTLSEFITINKSYVHKKPSHLSLLEASALPLAGVTAFRALFKKGKLISEDNLLITGIGGGVSTFILAFALKVCANIYVTSGSNVKIEKAISLGAKTGINYNNKNWDKEIVSASENKINIILDSAGGETFGKYLEICRQGGKIISYGATLGNVEQLNLHKVYWKQLQLSGSTMGSPNDFSEMLKFINDKAIVPLVDRVYDLTEIDEAFRRLSESEQFGKIIIKI